MSPRNWSECPQCASIDSAALKAQKDELQNSYGRISREEYEQHKSEIEAEHEDRTTLGEYYEWDFADDKFWMKYHAVCIHCGLDFTVRHEVACVLAKE